MSLMVKDSVDGLSGTLYPSEAELNGELEHNITIHDPRFISHDPVEAKIMIGTALAFYVGIIQVTIPHFFPSISF